MVRPLDATWEGGITLAGYDLDHHTLHAGQTAPLALYWQVEAPLETSYTVLVEVYSSDGILVGNAQPLCQPPAPIDWSPHYLNTTAFMVQADDSLPPGTYTFQVSLKHRQTGEPLLLKDEATHVQVTTFRVEGA